MISRCFAMIPQWHFQWVLCLINFSSELSAQFQRHFCVWITRFTVKRYFKKCSCKLTRYQGCIALPSNYMRHKGFLFISSSKKPLIFLAAECPCVLADALWHAVGLQIAFISSCRFRIIPGITVVQCHLLQTIWKSKETNGSDFDITVVVWFKEDLIKYWFESHQIINAYLVVHYQVISGNKHSSCFLCCCLFTLMDDNYIPTRALSSALQFAILFLLQ